MTKKKVTKSLERFYLDNETPLDELISQFEDYQSRYPEYKLIFSVQSDYAYEDSSEIEYFIVGERLETDQEYEDRLAQEERRKVAIELRSQKAKTAAAKREAKRYEELKKEIERLKPKYEKEKK